MGRGNCARLRSARCTLHCCKEDDMRSLLVLAIPLAILALASPSVAQAQVYCPNGQNLTKYGTQTYENRGNGGARNGNRADDNRAPNRPAYGNQVTGPNGRVCTRYGTQLYCN